MYLDTNNINKAWISNTTKINYSMTRNTIVYKTTLGTQDTGWRLINKTQHRKLKRWATWSPQKTAMNPGAREW
jgi:hypothetical protein